MKKKKICKFKKSNYHTPGQSRANQLVVYKKKMAFPINVYIFRKILVVIMYYNEVVIIYKKINSIVFPV